MPAWLHGIAAWLKRREPAILLLGFGLQALVLVGMIAFRLLLHATGEPILLRVVPVDPRDLFRGDYVTLSYDITQVPPDGIPGIGSLDYDSKRQWEGRTVYALLEPEADGRHWRAAGFSVDRPTGGKYIRGTIAGWHRISYGVESFYVQEGEGTKYEEAARSRTLSAEISLTSDGRAALRGLHIDAEPAKSISPAPDPSADDH